MGLTIECIPMVSCTTFHWEVAAQLGSCATFQWEVVAQLDRYVTYTGPMIWGVKVLQRILNSARSLQQLEAKPYAITLKYN